jgi:hypothetical protein
MKRRSALFACALLLAGCTGIFPTEAKIGPPTDHTVFKGGAAHKTNLSRPFTEAAGCSASECHRSDLRGGETVFEGRLTITPSCYQCHGRKWSGSPLASHAQ